MGKNLITLEEWLEVHRNFYMGISKRDPKRAKEIREELKIWRKNEYNPALAVQRKFDSITIKGLDLKLMLQREEDNHYGRLVVLIKTLKGSVKIGEWSDYTEDAGISVNDIDLYN